MSGVIAVDFENPDETRTFPNGRWDIVHIGDSTVARATMESGWHWADDVKPTVGTDSCQQRHVGFLVSGRMKVTTDSGDELTLEAGNTYIIEPGHDAWNAGDETVVLLEFASRSAATYAKPA